MSNEKLRGIDRESAERVKLYARAVISTAHELMDRAEAIKELRAQQGVVTVMKRLIADLDFALKPIEIPTNENAEPQRPQGVPPGFRIGR